MFYSSQSYELIITRQCMLKRLASSAQQAVHTVTPKLTLEVRKIIITMQLYTI